MAVKYARVKIMRGDASQNRAKLIIFACRAASVAGHGSREVAALITPFRPRKAELKKQMPSSRRDELEAMRGRGGGANMHAAEPMSTMPL